MEGTQLMTISVPSDKAVKMVDESREHYPPYTMVGIGIGRRGVMQKPIDFIGEMVDMTKQELFVIKTIRQAVVTQWEISTGEVYIPTSIFNSSELQTWKRGMKILKQKELVGSRKRSHFLLNPDAVIPVAYSTAKGIWDTIYPHERSKE